MLSWKLIISWKIPVKTHLLKVSLSYFKAGNLLYHWSLITLYWLSYECSFDFVHEKNIVLQWSRFEHGRLRCKYGIKTFTLPIGRIVKLRGSLIQMIVWLKRGVIISYLFVSYKMFSWINMMEQRALWCQWWVISPSKFDLFMDLDTEVGT